MADFDLSNIFKQLDGHFLEYIREHGREPTPGGFINCLNPNHPDRHPSMHIISTGEHTNTAGYCFSCHSHFSILNATHALENKPITGVGFYEETLPYLCKKYGIEYEPIQIDNKTRDMYQKRSGVRDAVNVIHGMAYVGTELNREHAGVKHILDRGITEDSIKQFKIGVVTSFKDYIDAMTSLGYDNRDWLASADLANKGIFTPNGVIIPIYDDKRRPVGFVTRTTRLDPNSKGDGKYINSINSDIYCKSEILFNFNNYDPAASPNLWIVEGYLDAVYLTQCGMPNVVALGSTAFTEQHVDLLSRHNVKNVILCLDGDEGGRNGTKLALEKITAYQFLKSLRVIDLPEGEDPDTFVRKNGKAALEAMANPEVALSAFAWTLKHTTFQDDPIAVVEAAIPAIAAEESTIVRAKMIRDLANITGLSRDDIRKDVELKVNAESDKFIEELTGINKFVQTALSKRKIRETKPILQEALVKIKNIETKFESKIDNRNTYGDKLNNLWSKIEHGNYKYGLYSTKFTKFEQMFDGIPFTTCLTLVGGKPSTGKTTLLQALAVDIVETNEDAAVFFMSIDDTTELMTLKMLAQKTGFATSKIKQFNSLMSEEQSLISAGWNWLDTLSSRFIMVDANDGTSPEALEAHIEWFVKEFPDKKKVFFLDNFHKLTFHNAKEKRDSISILSEKVKELTRLHDLHIMMTTELRKLADNDSRPTPADLKDTVQLEYDADVIIMIHNDLLVRENTNIIWRGQYGSEGERAMPYLETYVYKNKITGKTGGLAYKLDTYNLRVQEDSYATVKALKSQNAGHQVLKAGGKQAI
jgi:DNA primase